MNMNRNMYVLSMGVFGITTTEFAVIGVLPEIASAFHINIGKAGWLLSIFALIVGYHDREEFSKYATQKQPI
ncbi:hypothetical protein CRN76_05400 [Chryseobacterium indologenes]|nr:hypothetical protein CRN76_05400 [Chryseobacterium indologenes]AYY86372.1 MFS transporter [Chryseobacterium indologenes]HAO27474.1 MFS transporter [Chryseobacterium indologenes]